MKKLTLIALALLVASGCATLKREPCAREKINLAYTQCFDMTGGNQVQMSSCMNAQRDYALSGCSMN